MKNATGILMDIDHFAVHDGPGIRTCIYLKGCPLSCAWCHSPESQPIKPKILFAPARCINCGACVNSCPLGLQLLSGREREFLRERCVGCNRCVSRCPTGALFVSGREVGVEEVLREALLDRVFYQNSGGGVTVSGGEALMQPVFTRELLSGIHNEGIHTILETSGYGRTEDLLSFVPHTDLFYYDCKLMDAGLFRKYVGGELSVIIENLTRLREKTGRIVLRAPLIPEITDTEQNIAAIFTAAKRLGISEVHLLPYNAAAPAKYDWCGRTYPLGEMLPRPEQCSKLLKLAPSELCVRVME